MDHSFSVAMTVHMHIKSPSFMGLWPHLNLSGITLFILSSYTFPTRMCPPSFLPL